MVDIGFTPPGGQRVALRSLNSAGLGRKTLSITGTGVPPGIQQTVATPNRDGATWLRMVADQRFVLVEMAIIAANLTDLYQRRRALLAGLNPMLGLGVLDITWVEGGVTYEIDAILNGGAGIDTPPAGPRAHIMTLSFQCPDPYWREATPNTVPITASGGGLVVPLSIPWTLAEGGDAVQIINAGDVEVYPTIVVTGAFTGLKVMNQTTGKHTWFPGLTVSAGQTLTIDMQRRTADLDGVNVMPSRSADSESWPLALGTNLVSASLSGGSADVTLTYDTRLIGV